MKKLTKTQYKAVEEILVETGIILDWLGDKSAYVDRFVGDIMLSSSMMASVSINFTKSPSVLKVAYFNELGTPSVAYLTRKRSTYVYVEGYHYEDEYGDIEEGMSVSVGTKAAIVKKYQEKYDLARSQLEASSVDLLK